MHLTCVLKLITSLLNLSTYQTSFRALLIKIARETPPLVGREIRTIILTTIFKCLRHSRSVHPTGSGRGFT